MEVANPIYDVVFKYLLQNQRVARLLIGRITGLTVRSLTASAQETAVPRPPDAPAHDLPLTLLRIEEEEYPEECAFVLRQLREAMAKEDVRRTMQGEDLLLRDSILLARQVEHQERRTEQERERAEQERQRARRAEQAQQHAEQERRQERERAQRAEQGQQRAEQAQQQAEQERQQAELRLAGAIRRLHGLGQDAEAIAAALAVDADEVRRLLSG